MKTHKSILATSFKAWIGTIIILTIFFTTFLIYQRVILYKERVSQLKRYNDDSTLILLKQSVKNVVEIIDYMINEHSKPLPSDGTPQNLIQTKEFHTKVLDILDKIKSGSKSKIAITIINSDGDILLHPTNILFTGNNVFFLTDKQGADKFKYLVSECNKPGGKAIFKTDENMIYAESFKPFGWIICAEPAGFNRLTSYSVNKANLKIELILDCAMVILISAAMMIIVIIFSYSFSKGIKREINAILKYFTDYAERKEPFLDEEKIQYAELNFIGRSAKSMVSQIEELIQTVKQLAIDAEIANQSKSAFLASMSHELRTPMTGISGMTELLLESKLDEKQKEYLQVISDCEKRLVKILDEIAEFNQMENKGLQIIKKPSDLEDEIRTTADLLSQKATEKGISLLAKITSMPKYLLCDSKRIKQLINILVNNAIRFTEKGSIELEVSANSNDNKNYELSIKVSDQGPGISEEKLSKLFDFTKEKSSVTKKFGAVNLSLAVCKYLTNKMNGSITVSSKKNEGTVFSIRIPLQIPTPDQMQEVQPQKIDKKDSKTINYSHVKTLLAEDDSINRKMAVLFLEKIGIKPVVVANGKEALEKVKNENFDIIFMDCEMPVMDGLEASREIRKLENGKTIPIIAVTANALEADRQDCFDAGMTDHIAKPFKTESLKRILEKYIR
ncbi:MAG TPA: response regulator [Victivallales bacterium]|nr:response regulator [Victivallales bacterium]HPO89744.1 response regulator [Victivallales bacterium]HRR28104.1 response regulator [Victivallales bacterium]